MERLELDKIICGWSGNSSNQYNLMVASGKGSREVEL